MDENQIKLLISDCEIHLVVDDIDSFYKCIDSKGLSDWTKKDVVLVTDDADFIRLVAYKVVGRDVYSIIGIYKVTESGLSYVGFDVDVSDISDVMRVLGEL